MPASLPERLTPMAAERGVRAYYGDIHNHCALSYGHGSLDGALKRAALQLDFVSITGHAHWPDMPVDEPSVAHIVDFHEKGFAKLRAGWHDHFETLAAHDDEAGFWVFPGYEIHSCADGDYTIVYADLDADPIVLADTPGQLKQRLAQAKNGRALAFPHHIGYRQGARGINWDTFDADLSPCTAVPRPPRRRAATCIRWAPSMAARRWPRGSGGGSGSAWSAIPTITADFPAPMVTGGWPSMPGAMAARRSGPA